MSASNAFKRFWNSEAGPKTVHFWAPTLKWGLVFAGLNDISRPVEKVSGLQSLSLLATGIVWARWSFVIKPKNYLLASVNFFLACTAGYQIARVSNYRIEQGDSFFDVVNYIFNGPKKTETQESNTEISHVTDDTNEKLKALN